MLGKRIRDLRRLKRLSQEDLAERAGLHRNYIGDVERGERNVAIVNIAKVAADLDMSIAELFAPFTRRAKRP